MQVPLNFVSVTMTTQRLSHHPTCSVCAAVADHHCDVDRSANVARCCVDLGDIPCPVGLLEAKQCLAVVLLTGVQFARVDVCN